MSIDFPKNWKQVVLEDALDALIDYRGKTPKKVDKGIPLITAKVVKSGRILPMDEFIADEDYESWMVRGIPQISDIVVTTEAPLGEVAQIKNANVALAQRIVTLRGKVDFLENDFLLFLMQSDFVQNQLEARATGSTVKGIKQSELRKIILPIPPIAEQKCIGKILSDLDDKIHLNNQINQTLESIAQAIFKSWFIDFDPVRAKIAAKQQGNDSELAAMCAISGKSEVELHQMAEDDFAELQATAALFPDEFVESELGEVPKGWTLTLLKDVTTELRRGISPKYTEEPNGAIVINQKCIRNHTINFSLARKHDSSKRKIDGRELQIGDVLVNSTGVGTLGRIASVRYLDSITVVDSHVTVVRANDKKVSRAYLQGLLLENEKFIEASGAGTTGQTELRKEVLQEIKFPNPVVALHQQFDSIIYKINQEIANLEKMNISLSHVRDTLLPKLLSGEMDAALLKG